MEVSFTRTAQRRYRVQARRETACDLVMEPAPGFDPHLPHDLVHFLVERHWRLRHGIFGQLADGGDAGTFRPDGAVDRSWARHRARRNAAAGGGADMGRSEQLAALAFGAWQARRGHGTPVPHDPTAASDAELAALEPVLDDVAERWHAVPVGGSLGLSWPWPERRGRAR